MATPTQYSLSLKEIAEVILVKEGITEGRWIAGVNFGIQVGNMGIHPSNVLKPSASVIIDGFSISRIQENQPEPPKEMESLIVDATTLKR